MGGKQVLPAPEVGSGTTTKVVSSVYGVRGYAGQRHPLRRGLASLESRCSLGSGGLSGIPLSHVFCWGRSLHIPFDLNSSYHVLAMNITHTPAVLLGDWVVGWGCEMWV